MKSERSSSLAKLIAIILVCVLTSALLLPLCASAAATVTGKPTASVRLREYPSTNNTKTLQTLGTSDTVNVISKGKGADGKTWYKVNYSKYTGYILGTYLKVSNSGNLKTETYTLPENKSSAKATATPKKSSSSNNTPKPTATPKPSSPPTEELDWFTSGNPLKNKRGLSFKMKDVKTGKIINCKSRTSNNHLDTEPATAQDTQTLLSIYNRGFNSKRRPVLVKYGGHVYAGSMYCVPHGQFSVNDNNFDGHFCIHFTGSRTHESNRVDNGHQEAIKTALKYKW